MAACSTVTDGDNGVDPAMTAFAECLTENGVKMYGTAMCPYCTKQKEMFGEAFARVDYVDCQKDPNACTENGIQGVPAWIFADGTMKQGLQDLSVIAEIAGCELTAEEIAE